MDKKLTESLQKWLSTPREERDYEQGNLLLFRLSGNKIQYRNLAPNPAKHAEFITRNIQKYVNFRVQEFTHEQVKEMEKKVEKIFEKRLSIEENNPARDFKKGKRADHDSVAVCREPRYHSANEGRPNETPAYLYRRVSLPRQRAISVP